MTIWYPRNVPMPAISIGSFPSSKFMAMNKAEGKAVLATEMQHWRARSYADLAALIDEVITREVTGGSGAAYQIEIQIFWDSQLGGNLRVLGGIDDGGWNAFKPLNEDFIMAPDGNLVGE